MRAVFRTSASIVTILALGAVAGCGQRGALYLPKVPPMPSAPSYQTAPPVNPGQPAAPASAPAQ